MSLYHCAVAYVRDGKFRAENAAVEVSHEGAQVLWIPEASPARYTADSLDAIATLFARAAAEQHRIDHVIEQAELATIEAATS